MESGTSPRSVRETLQAVRELLTPPAAWTRFEWARDDSGVAIDPRSEDASKWCLLGAMCHIDGPYEVRATQVLRTTLGAIWEGSIAKFNDRSSHIEVLAALDNAIAATLETESVEEAPAP